MSETPVAPAAPNGEAQPTQYEKLRAVPWSLGYDVANTFFIQLTFFGSVFILFLDDLGLIKSQIGALLSVLPFLSLLSLFITPPVARFGYRRTFLLFIAIRNLFTAGLLLVPWLADRFDPSSLVRYVAFITIAFAASRAVAMTAFLPWQQEYIPQQMRGRYSGYSSIIVSLTGLVAVGTAGFLLDQPLGDRRYTILFGIGIVFGLVSIFLASHFPGGSPSDSRVSLFRFDKKVLVPLRDSRFLRYLVTLGLTTLALGPIFSFLPIFMKEKVGLNPGSIVLLQTGSLVGSLLSSFFWGWLADRYGSKPIALNGLLMTVLLPVFWLIMPRGSFWSLPVALSISLLQGIAVSGWGIGSGRLLFVSIASGESKTEYLSLYNAWSGLLSGTGSILGGVLLQSLAPLETVVFDLNIDSYSVLFGIGFVLSVLGVLLLSSLRIPRETGLGEFAGLFFQGSPLMAISSMIRFYYAREETDALVAAERLGTSRSPLTVDELISSLHDPRFYVRFEAIVSISRQRAHERLIQAVVDVLDGPDPALGVIAAWALGRMGDARALPALRKAFRETKYRSVQAHAARALGTLRDEESIPALLYQARNDPDLGIQVACASSLGKLKVIEAAPDIMHILYIDSYPQSRKEMGLSLARLLEAESQYIELSRSLEEDPGTALAQEMDNLEELSGANIPGQDGLQPYLALARELFARGQLQDGFQPLLEAMDLLASSEVQPHCRQILLECAARMREFRESRMEYPTLALVAMEMSLSETGPRDGLIW